MEDMKNMTVVVENVVVETAIVESTIKVLPGSIRLDQYFTRVTREKAPCLVINPAPGENNFLSMFFSGNICTIAAVSFGLGVGSPLQLRFPPAGVICRIAFQG